VPGAKAWYSQCANVHILEQCIADKGRLHIQLSRATHGMRVDGFFQTVSRRNLSSLLTVALIATAIRDRAEERTNQPLGQARGANTRGASAPTHMRTVGYLRVQTPNRLHSHVYSYSTLAMYITADRLNSSARRGSQSTDVAECSTMDRGDI
jgi:hypothetical protein